MKLFSKHPVSFKTAILVVFAALCVFVATAYRDEFSYLGHSLTAAVGSLGTSPIVSTSDHSLSLTLDTTDGGVAGISAGSTSLPLLPQRGGLSITEFNNKSLRTQYTVVYNGGSFTTPATSGTIPVSVQETYTSGSNYIRVDASVSSNQDLPLTVTYTLPINANGWEWHDTLRSSRTISSGGTYSYLSTDAGGAPVTTSVYPLGTISNGTTAITVAIPMNAPRLYTISYTPQGLAISFQVATSPDAIKLQGKASVSLVLYESSGAQGMRGALAHYYSTFPQFFQTRIPAVQHGSWNRVGTYSLKYLGAGPGTVVTNGTPETAWAVDYGYGMKNSGSNTDTPTRWSDTVGTLSNLYRQDWVYNVAGAYSYGPAVAQMRAASTTDPYAQAALSATAKNADGTYNYEVYFDGSTIQFHENTEVPAWKDLKVQRTLDSLATIAASNTGHPDAFMMDSWSGIQRWNAAFDYSRPHWAYSSFPLVPDFHGGVAELLAFPNYAYLSKSFAAPIHTAGLYIAANTNNPERRALGWLGADVIDFFGIESSINEKAINGSTVDSYAIWKRAIAYQRPVSTLQDDLRTVPESVIRSTLNQNVFYDIYISGDPGEGMGNTANAVPAMHTAAARAVFHQYTPVFKTLSAAGWEPVTQAQSNNSNVWLERYGSLLTNDMHLAVRNETGGPQTAIINLSGGAGKSYTLHDLLGIQADLTAPASNGNQVTVTVPARTTLVFRVIEKVALPATLSITAQPATVSYAGTTTISWTSTNTSFCFASGPNGSSGFSKQGVSGSAVVRPYPLTGSADYKLECRNQSGATTTPDHVVVTILPRPDVTAPSIRFISPTPLEEVSGAHVGISATSTDATGVAGVQFQLDGLNIGSEKTSYPYTLDWNSTLVANGSHTLIAIARDTSGNRRVSASRVITVRNTASTAFLSCNMTSIATTTIGSHVTFSWTTIGTATTAKITQGGTIVVPSAAIPTGSATLTMPTEVGRYTYLMTLTGAAGNVTCARDVVVLNPPVDTPTTLTAPTATPAAGTYTTATNVVLSAPSGALIRYTTNGTTPSCTVGTVYSAPIVIAQTTTIKAIACPATTASIKSNSLFVSIYNAFRSAVAAVVSTVTGGTVLPSSVAVFSYVISIPPLATNVHPAIGYIGLPNQSNQSCSISVWACDMDNLSSNLMLDFYEGSTKLGQTQANFVRADTDAIASACGASKNADGTYTKGFTPLKGYRVIFANLPVGTHWIDAYARNVDSVGHESGGRTLLPHTADYSSPVICNPSVMTGTLLGATTIITSSTKFSIGNTVQTTSTLNIRATPSTSGTLLGTQAVGAIGTVVGGPISANGFNWWNINYITGVDGWSNEDYLVKVTPPTTDTQSPTVSLVAPAQDALLSGNVMLSATASDNVGVATLQFYVDTDPVGPILYTPPYTTNWVTSSVADGNHNISAVARDARGNESRSTTVNVQISNYFNDEGGRGSI